MNVTRIWTLTFAGLCPAKVIFQTLLTFIQIQPTLVTSTIITRSKDIGYYEIEAFKSPAKTWNLSVLNVKYRLLGDKQSWHVVVVNKQRIAISKLNSDKNGNYWFIWILDRQKIQNYQKNRVQKFPDILKIMWNMTKHPNMILYKKSWSIRFRARFSDCSLI